MSEDGMHITRTPAGESPSGVSRSLGQFTDPESMPVGEGPLYEVIRAEAKKLAESWVKGGPENYQSYWGAGICGVTRENGKNLVTVTTFGREKRGLGFQWEESISMLRASAISLLVYCEAHDE